MPRNLSLTLTTTNLLLLTSLAFSLFFLHHGVEGWGEKCGANGPLLKQKKIIGFSNPPKYLVEVQNTCQMCPVINIHIRCGNFSQSLVNPKLLRVVGYNDCVVNGGWPLGPLQTVSFNYSHLKYNMSPSTWFFQCEY